MLDTDQTTPTIDTAPPTDPVVPPAPPVPTVDDSGPDEIAQQIATSQRLALSESLRQAQAQNPENAAKIVSLASSLRLHPSTVADQQQDAAAAVALQHADVPTLLRDHPALATWLLDQTNAAQSHDDLPALRHLDQKIRQLTANPEHDDVLGILPQGYQFNNGEIIRRTSKEFGQSIGGYQALGNDLQARDQAIQLSQDEAAARDRRVGATANPFLSGFLSAFGAPLKFGQALTGGNRDAVQGMDEMAQSSAEQHPGLLNDAFRMTGGLVGSLPTLLLGGPVAEAAQSIGVMRGTVHALGVIRGAPLAEAAAQKITERVATMAAMSPIAAQTGIISGNEHGATYGAVDGLINLAIPGAFGRVGVARALTPGITEIGKGGVDAALPAASFLLRQAGLDASQNAVIDLATAIHEKATGVDPHALDPSNLAKRLSLSALGGAVMGGVFNLPEANRIKLARQGMAIRQAQSEANSLSDATSAAIMSKTVQRSPESAKDLMRGIIAQTGGSGDTVYAQSEAFRAHYEGQGEDPKLAAAGMGVSEAAYNASITSGAPLPIPMEGWLAHAREADRPLLDHVTLRPDALTGKEAGMASEALRAQVDAQVKQYAQSGQVTPDQAAGDAALAASGKAVGDNVEAQLVAAGRAPSYARTAAKLWEKFTTAIAGRLNKDAEARGVKPITPEELFNQYKVRIAGPDDLAAPPSVDQAMKSLEQPIHPRGESLAFDDLLKQWRKANGDRSPLRGSEEWRKLTAEADAVDAANGRSYEQPEQSSLRMVDQDIVRNAIEKSKSMEPLVLDVPAGDVIPLPFTLGGEQIAVGDKATRISTGRNPPKRAILANIQKVADRSIPLVAGVKDETGRNGMTFDYHIVNVDTGRGPTPHLLTIRRIGGKPELYDIAKAETAPIDSTPGRTYGAGSAESKGAASGDNISLAQGDGRDNDQPGPRGLISIGADKSLTIRLNATADASTFFHESAHGFLEILTDLTSKKDAPAELTDMLQTVRDWVGSKPGEAWTVPQHEQFAEGFEKYLLEGVAPSNDLRRAFQRVKAWMLNLYQSLRNLQVQLSPEVRRVFDKLLATDHEIAQVRQDLEAAPAYLDAKMAGMTPAEFAEYQRAAEQQVQRSRDQLAAETMASEVRARRVERRDVERKVRAEMAVEVDKRQDMEALSALQDGKVPNDIQVPEGSKLKLDRAEIVAKYGEDYLKILPGPTRKDEADQANTGRRIYTNEGGMGLEEAALLFSYKNGEELLRALTTAPERSDLIDQATKAEMDRRYPDPLVDEGLRGETAGRLASDFAGEVLAREMNALERRSGREPTARQLVKEAATRTIEGMEAFRLRPDIYKATAAKAGKDRLDAALQLRDAAPEQRAELEKRLIDATQRQMMNLELFSAATKAVEAGKAAEEWIKKRDTLDGREKMGKAGGWEFTVTDANGQTVGTFKTEAEAMAVVRENRLQTLTWDRTSSYLDQWDQIMEGFALKRASNRALRRRESLREFVARLEADGEPVAIPDNVIDDLGKRRWQELTVAEQRDALGALKNVYQLATLKNKLLAAKRKRDLETLAGEMATEIEKNATGTHGTRMGTTQRESLKNGAMGYLLAHRKDSFLARRMDGYQDGGLIWETIILPRNEAADKKGVMQREAAIKRQEDLSAWKQTATSTRDTIPGTHILMTREQRIGLALHWGNREGRQRVLADLKRQDVPGTERDALAILDSLTPEDWALAKATWKQVNGYWSDIASLERRITGIAPDKVEALPFSTRHGQMPGGYFPIKYDETQGSKATNIDDATDAKSKLRAANLASSTRHGFTKSRSNEVQGRGLRYDFDVVSQHLNEVIHDLTHREMLQDQNRIFRNEQIAEAITKHYGKQSLDQLVNTVADIAQGEAPAKTKADKAARFIRKGVGSAVFGFNLTSALCNVSGVLQALPRVGAPRMLQALAHVTGDAVRMQNALAAVENRSAFMRERATTWNREVAEANRQVRPGVTLDNIAKAGYWPMTQVQRVVDTMTWHAGYDMGLEKANQKGLTDKAADEFAVAIADQTVIDTQGSGRLGDMAAVMRGGEMAKLLTVFYGYFSTTANLLGESLGRAVNKGEIAQLAGNAIALWFLPAVLNDIIAGALRGDKELFDPKKLARSEIAYGLGMLVGFRELSGVVQGHGYSGPGSLGLINRGGQFIQQLQQGSADQGLLKATVGAGLAPFGLPALEVQRMIDGYMEIDGGGGFATGLRAALFGKAR